MKRLAVLTSGGDAPGMNAAIRAVVRSGLEAGFEVFGVHHGYEGLMEGDFEQLDDRDVSGIIQLGGTMLGSARSPEFKTDRGQEQALERLRVYRFNGLIVIGGNGSQTGANALSQKGFPVVGIASTIDNDLYGSEVTIGVDTALNIALEAIDRLKVTAASHHRAFLVEVMGRNCGYLALMSGLAGGAEAVVIPEYDVSPDVVAAELTAAYNRGKSHGLIVVAEGAKYNAAALAEHFRKHEDRFGFEVRATTLGHVQRGGAPGAFDRLLASRLGAGAVAQLDKGEPGALMGLVDGKITATPLNEVVTSKKSLDPHLIELARVLAR